MIFSDITEVQECFRAGEDAKLLDVFQRFIFSDEWPTKCYEWGEENAEEYSAFIQHIVPLLPPSMPMEVVLILCEDYLLELVYLPNSIDIGVKVLIDFWNRKRAMEDESMVRMLSAFLMHPDGEHVVETIQRATGGLTEQLGINKDTKSC